MGTRRHARRLMRERLDMEQHEIEAQVRRCHRLADSLTDDDMRRSLQRLAEEFRAQLPPQNSGFMLTRRDD